MDVDNHHPRLEKHQATNGGSPSQTLSLPQPSVVLRHFKPYLLATDSYLVSLRWLSLAHGEAQLHHTVVPGCPGPQGLLTISSAISACEKSSAWRMAATLARDGTRGRMQPEPGMPWEPSDTLRLDASPRRESDSVLTDG